MNILVCVKAVPSKLLGKQYAGSSIYSINPYDAYSIQTMLQLRTALPCTITCICMGPESAREVLVRCLAMGADRAILLSDYKFAESDTFATSYILSKAIERLNYDLIVCGQMAVDGETGQVVYGIAQRLNMVCVSKVQSIQSQGDKLFLIKYLSDENIRMVQARTPLVISFDNLCEYASVNLLALQRARKREITVWNSMDLNLNVEQCGLIGSKTKVYKLRQQDVQAREATAIGDTGSNISSFLINQIKTNQ